MKITFLLKKGFLIVSIDLKKEKKRKRDGALSVDVDMSLTNNMLMQLHSY